MSETKREPSEQAMDVGMSLDGPCAHSLEGHCTVCRGLVIDAFAAEARTAERSEIASYIESYMAGACSTTCLRLLAAEIRRGATNNTVSVTTLSDGAAIRNAALEDAAKVATDVGNRLWNDRADNGDLVYGPAEQAQTTVCMEEIAAAIRALKEKA